MYALTHIVDFSNLLDSSVSQPLADEIDGQDQMLELRTEFCLFARQTPREGGFRSALGRARVGASTKACTRGTVATRRTRCLSGFRTRV